MNERISFWCVQPDFTEPLPASKQTLQLILRLVTNQLASQPTNHYQLTDWKIIIIGTSESTPWILINAAPMRVKVGLRPVVIDVPNALRHHQVVSNCCHEAVALVVDPQPALNSRKIVVVNEIVHDGHAHGLQS